MRACYEWTQLMLFLSAHVMIVMLMKEYQGENAVCTVNKVNDYEFEGQFYRKVSYNVSAIKDKWTLTTLTHRPIKPPNVTIGEETNCTAKKNMIVYWRHQHRGVSLLWYVMTYGLTLGLVITTAFFLSGISISLF